MSIKTKKMDLTALEKRLGPMTVGGFLRSWRLSEEHTQQEFAELIGMSAANLCDIEKGRKGISVEKAAKIAEAIDYSPTVLIKLTLKKQLQDAGLEYNIEVKNPANDDRRASKNTGVLLHQKANRKE